MVTKWIDGLILKLGRLHIQDFRVESCYVKPPSIWGSNIGRGHIFFLVDGLILRAGEPHTVDFRAEVYCVKPPTIWRNKFGRHDKMNRRPDSAARRASHGRFQNFRV